MSDLISREALLEVLRGLKPSGFEQSFAGQAAIRNIEAAPAVDAEPVRYGKWIIHADHVTCSACYDDCYADSAMSYLYCPNCGAKMEEDG